MTTDLERAYLTLQAKHRAYSTLWNYYDGDQPVVYTAARLREIFEAVDARFNENWCEIVINATADRLAMRGFTVADDEESHAILSELWDRLNLPLESDDAHRAALVCGESYILAWRDEAGAPQVYFNDPRLCHLFYDAEDPRRKSYGCKWYVADDEHYQLVLYYPDRIETYRSTQRAEQMMDGFRANFDLHSAEPHPFGDVPLFHLRLERRRVKSDLANVIPLQNAVNKLLIDLMVAAEYGAFRQRYIISNAENLGKLRNAPNEIWDLPTGDGQGQETRVGEFSATDLSNYSHAIAELATAIGAITRTPKHFFFQQGGDPSGEALIAMEAPLNKKVQDRIDRFLPVWRDVAAFLLRLVGRSVDPRAIHPLFDRPETVQPLTEAMIVQTETASGIPLMTSLRRRGWSESELAQLTMDQAAGVTPAAPPMTHTTLPGGIPGERGVMPQEEIP